MRFFWWTLHQQRGICALADRLARHWGWASRRVRLALHQTPPYRRRELDVFRGFALGDVLLCTPALRELKLYNPDCRLTFHTAFPSLVAGLPFIDEVRYATEAPAGAICLSYENSIPPMRHLAKVMGDHLGVNVTDVRPSCVVNETELYHLRESWRHLPHPRIIVNRRADPGTPNKDWPEAHWNELIDRLLNWSSVIEIGLSGASPENRDPMRYLSLVGKTSLDQLVAAIAAADLHVGPSSGPAHIAAAFRIPTVIIHGGYEHPVGTSYDGNVALYSKVECAPCWPRDACPHGKKCLSQITPDVVERSLRSLWRGQPAAAMAISDSVRSRPALAEGVMVRPS